MTRDMRARAIVNPNSSHGRTRRAWPEIHARLQAALGPVEVAFTEGPMAAARLTRAALQEGVEHVIACGGDGTNNEVVNGFFAEPRPGAPDLPIRPGAVLSVLMLGTGGDFRKSFGAPAEPDAQIERIAAATPRPLDIGRLDYTADDGAPASRYFVNIASFGASGEVDRAVNRARWTKKISGALAFFVASASAMARYRPSPVRLRVDDGPERTFIVNVGAVCNGRYFGGGMHVAPMADPGDGVLELVVMHDMGLWDLLRDPRAIYRGEHLASPKVAHLRGRKVEALPAEGKVVLLDVDGEAPGRLPATFTLLPGAISLRY